MSEQRPCMCGAHTEAILRQRAVFFRTFEDMQELSAAPFELPVTKGKVLLAIVEVEK